jgi:hypothetical protein
MKLDRLISFFSLNPSAKLLRSPHAAYVVFFLHEHFKVAGNLATPHGALQLQLNQFLEQVHERSPNLLRDHADTYLTQWSTGDSRWLSRYFDAAHAESVYQLTPHTEDVLKFLTEVLDRNLGFVGTESRLKRIIDTLSDLVIRGSADTDRRLEYLQAQRARIDQEIRAIESGEAVSTHSPTAIRERFADAISDLTSLQGDFRAVEESFKNITRTVQKQQAESVDSRGEILGYALEAEDHLKAEDQGVSFDEFVRLILSHTKQDELEAMIGQLREIPELVGQLEGMRRVEGMIGSLSAEAEKVLRTTRRLSTTLRRLLDSRSSTRRLRLASVLRDIQRGAARLAENSPEVGCQVYTELGLLNVSQRTFWESPTQFEVTPLVNREPDEDDRMLAFRSLAGMQRLDWETMRSSIAQMVESRGRTSLPELLEIHPLTSGPIELLGYLQLAHDGGHEVDEGQVDLVYLPKSEVGQMQPPQPYEIPRVVFLSEPLRLARDPLVGGNGLAGGNGRAGGEGVAGGAGGR